MAGPITIRVNASGGSAARAELARTAESATLMGKSMSRAGKLIAGAFAVGALARASEAVGKVGASYVDSLNKIQALTGATNKQIDSAAKQLEANTSVYAKYGQTAGDAAAGVVELTKSGQSLGHSLKEIRGTMVLAKAGELSVADASTLVANTLNTFSLKASQAGKIANDLANAANISSADVRDLAESFKYAAPLAAKAGLTVDQTSAILAELSNSGIKASQAGTSLRQMLIRLQAPTTAANITLTELGVSVFDAQGKMKPFRELVGELGPAIDKLKGQDRAYALKNLFGINALTAASVVLKNGTKGLDDYTKGVNRAGAAQKLAGSASRGLAGTLASLKAQATSTTQALYREYSPDLNKAIKDATRFISEHKDEVEHAAVAVEQKLAPALQAIATLARDTAQAFGNSNGGLAHSLGVEAGHALSDLLELTTKAANALDKIPAPLKSVGVEAGIAALILPRLTASVTSVTTSVGLNIARLQQWRAELSYTATRTQATSAALSKLGSAARAAAGVGGIVALTEASKVADERIKLLGNTAGGALLGFSLGGPWGAAIGAGAGALLTLGEHVLGARKSMQKAVQPAIDYASSLNQITGAAEKATRATVLQDLSQQGVLSSASALGLTSRDLVDDLLGQEAATKRVNAAIKAARQNTQLVTDVLGINADGTVNAIVRTDDLTSAADKLAGALGQSRKSLRDQADQVRQNALATADLSQIFKGLPKAAITQIKAQGLPQTRRDVADLAGKFKLTPRQIHIVIRQTGINTTTAQTQVLVAALKSAGEVKPDLRRNFARGLNDGLGIAIKQTKQNTGTLVENLTKPLKGVHGNIPLYLSGLIADSNRAKGIASSGGRQVGAQLSTGTAAGIRATGGVVTTAATSIISQALAAMRARAKIHSPSRETYDIAVQLGRGLSTGLAAQHASARKAGHDVVTSLLGGIENGTSGIDKALDRISKLIDQRIKGKDQEKRQARVLKGLRDEYAALRANGKQQDKNTAALDKATQRYKALVSASKQYAATIKASVVDFGNIVGLGADENGTVTLSSLVDQLKDRVADAKRFAALIKELTKAGLNRTEIQELLDAGPAAALSTAEAISSGGAAAIKQLNTLSGQLSQTGSQLGDAMAKQFKLAGIQAAAGIVEGLSAKQKDLDKAAQRLGEQLAAAVKKSLGIKSPSTVFRGIADDTVAGLTRQLKANETYVTRSAASLAQATVRGYGTPALDVWNGTSSASSSVKSVVEHRFTAQEMTDMQNGRVVVRQSQAAELIGKRRRAGVGR